MNKKKPTIRFLTLTQTHWVYLTITVLLIVPFLIAVLCSDEIYNAYVRAYVAPGVQRQFGFRMDRKRMYYRHAQPLDVFVITAIEPMGVLGKAGVRNNDIPLGVFHAGDVSFYQRLKRSQKEAIELRLINSDDYEEWLKTGESSLSARARRVVIPRQAN